MTSFHPATLFKCRLCWQVTLGVFALIFSIESVLLVPSARRFLQVETDRLAVRTQTMVDPALVLGPGLDGRGPIARDLATLLGKYQIDGLLVRKSNGSEMARAGWVTDADTTKWPNTMTSTFPVDDSAALHAADVGERKLAITWRSAAANDTIVTAFVDAGFIQGELIGYLVRLGGLIFVIVFVVTLGTMLLVYRTLLKPILQLRKSAISAGQMPWAAAQFRLVQTRRDELGDLIVAHNHLLIQVTESIERERRQAEEREHYLSRHNTSTGLPNRVALLEYFEGVGLREPVGTVSVFLVELQTNGFSTFDATTAFATALASLAGSQEFFAQIESARFVWVRLGSVSAHEPTYSQNARIAEQILDIANRENFLPAGDQQFEIRIGIVESTIRDINRTDPLGQAEFALQRVQRDPAIRYQFFDRASADEARARQHLTRDLAFALTQKELVVWFQPKFSLQRPGMLSGMEALVRWPHATLGMISPAQFVPLAEATGQIQAIDRYVFAAVCHQLRNWLRQYPNLAFGRIAVNFAAPSLDSPDLATDLQSIIEANQISGQNIEIEITETAAMKNVAQTTATLYALKKLGMHTAIDDFGTGYSSLSYLTRFAIDNLKIDRSFVDEIGGNGHTATICGAIVRLGHAIGTRVIAEGVETAAQAAFLTAHGCDEAQGFLFGRPLPAEEFACAWLAPQANKRIYAEELA